MTFPASDPNRVFCYRCHQYQTVAFDTGPATVTVTFPDRCADVAVCRSEWDRQIEAERNRIAAWVTN